MIEKRENAGIKNYNDPTAFIEYSNTMDDVFSNIDDYNPKRKRKILIVIDDMISDIMTNKSFQAIIKELFIRCRKLNISLVFITQSYFSVPKEARLNSSHYLIMEIKANKVQYDLDREAAKISALSSGELEKYEYLTGEDLGYKLDVTQKAKFEYSSLGKVFNKGLNESNKKEGLLKRLKNIEGQSKINEENKDNQLGVKSIGYTVKEELSQEAKNMLDRLNNQEKLIDYRKLNFKGGNNVDYDFTNFRP